MHFIPFHVNRAERTCRTKVLASPATDATLHVDSRDLRRIGIACIRRYHLNGSRRAMPGTVAAFHTIGQRHAVLPYPYGMTYLRGGFIRYGYRTYRSGWAYFAAFRTLRSAVTTLITHFRLHQPRQISGRAKHLVGAGRHTELAGSTMLCEMPCAQCSRRDNRGLAVGNFLVLNNSQTSVHFLFLRFQCSSRGDQSRSGQERAAGIIDLLCRNFGSVCIRLYGFLHRMLVADGSLVAHSDAIHTSYTTAIINSMFGDVDTSRLTIPGTQLAIHAFVRVNRRFQPRETGKDAQHRTYRADGIAVSPSVPPRQYSY